MSIVLTVCLIVFLTLFIAAEISALLTFGKYASNSYIKTLNTIPNKDIRYNSYSRRMLHFKQLPYIAITPWVCLLAKYYIEDVGQVLRFTKLHYKIEQMYEEAKKNFVLQSINTKP